MTSPYSFATAFELLQTHLDQSDEERHLLGVVFVRLLWALPIVIIGAILAMSIIGAFQLRQDERLNEDNFLKLMGLSFKNLLLLKKPDDTIQ